jgi:hypothetical protein
MSEFNFKSPGVKISERVIPVSEQPSLGETSFGMVGETSKGPAFEPVAMTSMSDFNRIFGGVSSEKLGDSLKYLLPHYADSFFKEADKLHVTRVLGLSGYTAGPAWAIVADGLAGYSGMVLAVIRSRGGYDGVSSSPVYFTTTVGTPTGDGLTNINSTISIQLTTTVAGIAPSTLTFSLNPDSANFITKVIGTHPGDKKANVYVEAVYPELIKKLSSESKITAIKGVYPLTTASSNGFNTSYKTPSTPYVVSELRGTVAHKLFKVVSISDGESANTEIKVSFENINPVSNEFDVVVRDFNDTDDNVVVLERFSRCVMDTKSANFVGRRIGAILYNESDAFYNLKSNYIYLEMADSFPEDAIPAGFEGYDLRAQVAASGSVTLLPPSILFKSSYATSDRVGRTYLGISERAYDTVGVKQNSFNTDLFKYQGNVTGVALTKSKGFHMDSDAPTATFVVGAGTFRSKADIEGAGKYADKASRKFTVALAGGFDGWDIYADKRTISDADKTVNNSDYQAYLNGVMTFSNPEDTDLTLFATPGINWSDNTELVKETLEIIEEGRRDCLYIMDAPSHLGSEEGTIDEIVDLWKMTDIESSFAATYYPPIQVENKANRSLVYIPATGEVARTIALTDREKFLWFANAGTTRGVIPSAIRAKIKLKEEHRNKLHTAGINPIAQFREVGVDIFGQRTTLLNENDPTSRINVRKLVNHAKYVAAQVARSIMFEQNDEVVVSEFMKKVNPILANIKRERGLHSFEIVYSDKNTPESNDRRQLFMKLILRPVASLEEIGLEFELTPQGGSF